MSDEAKISRELAERDLESINRLREDVHFTTYFMRRLRMKREALMEKFYNEPPSKCTPEEREIRRRICKEYDAEILNLLDSDEMAIRSLLQVRR